MSTRIEVVELLSFKLIVPRETLERLPEDLDTEVKLVLEREEGELVLAESKGDSFLRFREIKGQVAMSGALICNDVEGRFFREVLCALVMRFGGDMDARIMWNDPALNTGGDYAELRMRGGKAQASRNVTQNVLRAVAAGEATAQGGAPIFNEKELMEIEKLLERADREWAEYQRLKAERLAQGA